MPEDFLIRLHYDLFETLVNYVLFIIIFPLVIAKKNPHNYSSYLKGTLIGKVRADSIRLLK